MSFSSLSYLKLFKFFFILIKQLNLRVKMTLSKVEHIYFEFLVKSSYRNVNTILSPNFILESKKWYFITFHHLSHSSPHRYDGKMRRANDESWYTYALDTPSPFVITYFFNLRQQLCFCIFFYYFYQKLFSILYENSPLYQFDMS